MAPKSPWYFLITMYVHQSARSTVCSLGGLQMPVMDGLRCYRQIRELEKSGELPGRLPIIGMVASALHENVGEIKAAGCDEVLRKPMRPRYILYTIKYHVRPSEVQGISLHCWACDMKDGTIEFPPPPIIPPPPVAYYLPFPPLTPPPVHHSA